jgi:glycosyltransferase involved in cell wall biosynthesis
MSNRPLASIIISSYNYALFLNDAIDSALNQTYSPTEVIIVDDGSTDKSPEIVAEYGKTVTAIFKKNGGQASAFNAGFQASLGEVVIFLDSDDILLPTAIGNAVAGFDSPEVAKVHWPLWKIDATGKKTGELDPKFQLATGDLLEKVVQSGPNHCGGPPYSPPTSGIAWSRKFLEKVFPIPEVEYKTCTDQYLFVLAPVYGELRSIGEPQGYYRIHGNNYSLNPLEEYLHESLIRFEQSCQVLSRHLKNKGIQVFPGRWARDSWYHRLDECMQEIAAVVPPEGSFILVDEDQLGTNERILGRYRIPFLERNGKYWGQPDSDETAIEEIQRQRERGASSMIFAWTAFWWLDYYSEMHKYLRSNYKCLLNNERLIVFSLQPRKFL